MLCAVVPRGALAGAAFAVPAVAWALLAHLPLTGQAPPTRRLFLVALVAVLLAIAAEIVRPVLAGRRAAPAARHQHGPRRRIGGPRTFGGLLAVQGLLHAALAAVGCGAAPQAARGDRLLGVLLCHDGRAGAASAVQAARAVVGSALRPGPTAPAQEAGSGLAHVDPALLAAARRVAAGTGSADASAAGHRHVDGLAAFVPASASAGAAALAMLLAHALAAALMFWWARRGAEVLVAAGRLLACRLPTLQATSPRAAPALRFAPIGRAGSRGRPRLLLLRHAVARRGPPVPLAIRSFRDAWRVAAV
ncbi:MULTISPECIES: hypothetical protein [Frankia]|uniref:hypothetical protein n=1 Tax=Frankia TaxID=1854 RepID=UPI001E5608CD|nr:MULTISPECIES: hypothetical protein [Frankia]